MTDYKPTVRQDQSHPSTSGTYQRDQGLSIAAATLLIIAVFEYFVIEAITASAWKTPVYSYASNWISDLGVPDFGITLVGTFHGSTAATENGTVAFHFLGAFMAIPAGNIIAIVTGFQWHRLKIPRWFGRISIVLGIIGIVNVIVLFPTIGRIPSGIPERASVYTIFLWQLLTGIVLLVACVNARGPKIKKTLG